MIDPVVGLAGVVLGLLLGPWLGIAVDRMVEREAPEADHRCAQRLPRPGDDGGPPVIDAYSPFCGASLGGPRTLVPLVGWRSACPRGHGWSWRYLLVDVAAAVALGLVFARFAGEGPLLAVYAVFAAAVVVLAVIDLETKLLVNIGTYPLMLFMAFAILVISGNQGDTDHLYQAIVGGSGYTLFFAVLYRLYPAGLGFGDVKLAPSLGMAMGWLSNDPFDTVTLVINSILIASLGGSLVGLAIGWRRGNIRKAEIAFGPAMVVGAMVVIVAAPWMAAGAR